MVIGGRELINVRRRKLCERIVTTIGRLILLMYMGSRYDVDGLDLTTTQLKTLVI